MPSCDTAYTLEARSKVIDVLRLNRELKQAVKQRIGSETVRANAVVYKFIKKL